MRAAPTRSRDPRGFERRGASAEAAREVGLPAGRASFWPRRASSASCFPTPRFGRAPGGDGEALGVGARGGLARDPHDRHGPEGYASAVFRAGGRQGKIVGFAKGAGMIHPDMATMLAFVPTDVSATPEFPEGGSPRGVRRELSCDLGRRGHLDQRYGPAPRLGKREASASPRRGTARIPGRPRERSAGRSPR